jgi:hypothetical protein
MVLSQELPQLRRACAEVYPATDTKKGFPRFTIVVCGKRHKTRFYPTTAEGCDIKSHNTKPGTVVDRGVTEARNWCYGASSERKLLLHKLMCIVLSAVVIALCRAIRVICLHDVSLMYTCLESALGEREERQAIARGTRNVLTS